MTLLQALVFGVVQGVTEFLPVSSTAHLFLVAWLLDWSEPDLTLIVALHLGTLAAIAIVLWPDLRRLAAGFLRTFYAPDLRGDADQRLAWLLALATVPAVLVGLLLEKRIEGAHADRRILVFTLAAFGVILLLADRYGRRSRVWRAASVTDAVAIGLAQACAIVPGVSRSGATISAGLFCGLTREDATRFSFLLSVPIVLGRALYRLKDASIPASDRDVLLVGIVAAAATGVFALRWLIAFVQRNSFTGFALYRLVVAAARALAVLG